MVAAVCFKTLTLTDELKEEDEKTRSRMLREARSTEHQVRVEQFKHTKSRSVIHLSRARPRVLCEVPGKGHNEE